MVTPIVGVVPPLDVTGEVAPIAVTPELVTYPAPLVIALLFNEILAEPLKLTPAIVLAVCKIVAVPAFPETVVCTILLVLAVLANTAVLFVIKPWTVVV